MSITGRLTLRVEWGDCDPAEIVFYPNYFRWFDAGAHNLFRSVGAGWEELFQRHGVVGVPLLEASAKFRSPSRVGDEIVVESRILAWQRKTFTLEHRVFNAEALAVEGGETRAWCLKDPEDPARLKAAPIPDEVKALFAG